MMVQDSKLLCSLDHREWGRPPQLPWSVRSVWKHKDMLWGGFSLFFCVFTLVWYCYIHDSIAQMDFHLFLTVFCVLACRSWALAMWRWTPAALAARTAWRKSSLSHWTTPASRTSTKVILLLFLHVFCLLYILIYISLQWWAWFLKNTERDQPVNWSITFISRIYHRYTRISVVRYVLIWWNNALLFQCTDAFLVCNIINYLIFTLEESLRKGCIELGFNCGAATEFNI